MVTVTLFVLIVLFSIGLSIGKREIGLLLEILGERVLYHF